MQVAHSDFGCGTNPFAAASARLAPLLIISPMFPPMAGGLPDHTDHLAAALSRHFAVTVLTSPGVEKDRSAFAVRPEVVNWQNGGQILGAIEKVGPEGPILWQYVPHMYGRGGVNLKLPSVLEKLRADRRRQLVLVHEVAAPFSWWPHRSAYALAQRIMWRAVKRNADAMGISTGGWLEQFLARDPSLTERAFLTPSPSNLPVIETGVDHRQKWLKAANLSRARRILGFFGTVGAGKQFEWVLAAWRAVRRIEPASALIVIGGKPVVPLDPDEQGLFHALGYADARTASEALQALDLLVLPFVDGVSERRSSFMAGLAHGVPVLTTAGPATGKELRDAEFLHRVETDLPAFCRAATELISHPDTLQATGDKARAAYRARYDWPRLAERIADRISPWLERSR